MDLNLTLLGEAITFAIFVWFTMRFVWPPLVRAMDERQQKIADGLAAADKGQHALKRAEAQVAEQMAETKRQVADILDAANKQANQLVEQATEQAKEKADRIVAGAQADIEQEVERAREGLRQRVATLAVMGAEKLLHQQIDEAANKALLDQLASEL